MSKQTTAYGRGELSLAFALGVFFLSLPEEKPRGVPEAAAQASPRTRDHVHRTAAKPADKKEGES